MDFLSDAKLIEFFAKVSQDYTLFSSFVIIVLGWIGYKYKVSWLIALVGYFKKVRS